MTRAEVLELQGYFIELTMVDFSIYLTVTFAYLIVAYLAGARLTRFQAIAATGMYLVAAVSTIGGMIVVQDLYIESLTAEPLITQSMETADPIFWKVYMNGMMLVGIFVSVYFLYDVRKRGAV